MMTSNVSSIKLLRKDLLQFVGDFLEPDSAQKMRETSKQWSSVKIYENIFPNESEVALLRNVNTEEIIWVGDTMPNQEKLVSNLRRNDSEKWNDVFLWFAGNWSELMNKPNNKTFLKALMLAIAENVDVKLTDPLGWSPLMLAAMFDDKDSILALIKRGANVNQRNISRWTALHFAAVYGNIDACATLLDNNANIDAADHGGYTPLMDAANVGRKNNYKFLIKKGADQNHTDDFGRTASQLARFQQR